MASTPEHKQLMRLLISQQRNLSAIYSNMSTELATVLRRYRARPGKKVWHNNLRVKKEVERILEKYRKIIFKNIEIAQLSGWNLSESHSDKLVNGYTKGFELSETLKNQLLRKNTIALYAFQKRVEAGLKLSKRVYNLRNQTQSQIETFLAEGLSEGRSAVKLAGDLKRYLKEPQKRFRRIRDKETGKLILSNPAKNYNPGKGVYRSSFKNALRLTRNETNIAYRSAEHERRKNLPFVLGIKVNLSNSHLIYDICDELQGMYPKDFVFTGWHVNCLCFTTSKLMSNEQFGEYLKTGKVPNSIKTKGIPPAARIYLKDNAEKILKLKHTPDYITENFKTNNNKLKLAV